MLLVFTAGTYNVESFLEPFAVVRVMAEDKEGSSSTNICVCFYHLLNYTFTLLRQTLICLLVVNVGISILRIQLHHVHTKNQLTYEWKMECIIRNAQSDRSLSCKYAPISFHKTSSAVTLHKIFRINK